MAAKKEVAEKNDQLPAEYEGYAEYDGAGFENQTSDDYAIPFIGVLQSNSPQLEENEDLKAGMIINTVTGDTVSGKEGLAFVPCYTQHNYVEFKPRDSGGGFVAAHDVNSDLVRRCVAEQPFGAYTTPDGNELIETFYVYGIVLDDEGNGSEAVIAFTSTKIKKYKAWQTKAKTIQIPLPDGRRIKAPLFSHRYRLKTVLEKNSKGSYYNWDVSFDGENAREARLSPNDELFQKAVACKDMVQEGTARADYDKQNVADAAEGGNSDNGDPKF